ncbi:MAG: hypothetical protein ACRCYU_03805 [Nocardioides sp.]
MNSHSEVIGIWLAGHRIAVAWLSLVAVSWGVVTSFALITLPLQFPYEAAGQFVNSGVVVGLVVPVAITAGLLEEGPAQLLAGAARELAAYRVATGVVFLVLVVLLASLAALPRWVPSGLVIGDSACYAALTLLGTGVVGLGRGWLLPLGAAMIASAPGVIPWQVNYLYLAGHGDDLAPVTAVTALLGLVVYARCGSAGLWGARRLCASTETLPD